MTSCFLLQFSTEELRDLSDRRQKKKEKNPSLHPFCIPFPVQLLKLEVGPLEGSMNLGKNSSFLLNK
jgi:hypothetical protein